jgi:NADH-quinone oxidoreductase subunit L
MTVPLMLLAVCSVGVAWGWPVWNAEASVLGKLLHESQPPVVAGQFENAIHEAEKHHLLAGALALGLALTGAGVAFAQHRAGTLLRTGGRMANLFRRKLYFDELYAWVLTQPTLRAAKLSASVDKPTEPQPWDFGTLDGLLASTADVAVLSAHGVQRTQTGVLRQYILALGLTLVAGLAMLFVFIR